MASNNYSYSKIDTYVQCPFKYKLKYVDGNYCYHDTVNTEVGTLIHSCEESIAKAIQSNTKIGIFTTAFFPIFHHKIKRQSL